MEDYSKAEKLEGGTLVKSIAVVGAGPKGVAIASKASAINDVLGYEAIEVSLFDPLGIGASWRGGAGLTDGFQRICTPIERDLGFPYASELSGLGRANEGIAELNALMLRKFSWQSYLISSKSYGDWVSAGCVPPSHFEFSEYLEWAAKKLPQDIVEEGVLELTPSADLNSWILRTSSSELEFDGVVLTGGMSDPRRIFGKGDLNIQDRCHSASTYWSEIDRIAQILRETSRHQEEIEVGFAGSGAAAATIASDLIRRRPDLLTSPDRSLTLKIFSREGASMRLRHPNLYEDRLFHDKDRWNEFPDKTGFINQAVNGAVWTTLFDQFSFFSDVKFIPVSVVGAKAHPQLSRFQVAVELHSSPEAKQGDLPNLEPEIVDILIDCRAPSAKWFMNPDTRVLPEELCNYLRALSADSFERDLSYRSNAVAKLASRLHAPMLSTLVTPGASNLMALGVMSDHILSSYM